MPTGDIELSNFVIFSTRYGFPIGGVGAFDADEGGVLSVGGVGFDGGCGVRCLATNLKFDDLRPKIRELVDNLFKTVPAGVGKRGQISLNDKNVDDVLINGAKWVVSQGYGTEDDLKYIEDNGRVDNADPAFVSETALKREERQVGTLGSGNHYLELQRVDEIFDANAAKTFGLEKDQILVAIHCGSRALGHQIGTDYLKTLASASRKYNIPIRERELVCAPINSDEGQEYFKAMCCALNYAFANRQIITHLVRKSFNQIFPDAEIKTFYDISHNSAKKEKHKVDGKLKELYVHRKGATRAFGPGTETLPIEFRKIGQPVLIGGTLGTSSFILHGTKYGMDNTFGSSCHGAGRAMSRTQASNTWRGEKLIREMEQQGIYCKCHSMSGFAEEAPGAYKDVEDVVDSMHYSGVAMKVVKVKPVGNIKG